MVGQMLECCDPLRKFYWRDLAHNGTEEYAGELCIKVQPSSEKKDARVGLRLLQYLLGEYYPHAYPHAHPHAHDLPRVLVRTRHNNWSLIDLQLKKRSHYYRTTKPSLMWYRPLAIPYRCTVSANQIVSTTAGSFGAFFHHEHTVFNTVPETAVYRAGSPKLRIYSTNSGP